MKIQIALLSLTVLASSFSSLSHAAIQYLPKEESVRVDVSETETKIRMTHAFKKSSKMVIHLEACVTMIRKSRQEHACSHLDPSVTVQPGWDRVSAVSAVFAESTTRINQKFNSLMKELKSKFGSSVEKTEYYSSLNLIMKKPPGVRNWNQGEFVASDGVEIGSLRNQRSARFVLSGTTASVSASDITIDDEIFVRGTIALE